MAAAQRQNIMKSSGLDQALLQGILSMWGIELETVLPQIPIQGSPERCRLRTVVGATGGHHFLIEQLYPGTVNRKQAIAVLLESMAATGLPIAPPLRGTDGEFVQHWEERAWQLTPYVAGIPLDQAGYWREAWRGKALASFLYDLSRAAQHIDIASDPFDLAYYVSRIEADTRKYHPKVHHDLDPVFRLLDARLPGALSGQPMTFCHGDPHPLNVIWGDDRIQAVIDWEFCGRKHALYDIALVVGCVGSEAPGAMHGPFLTTFLKTLRDMDILTPELEPHLPVCVLAQRIPWLAEWLRRNDTDMIDFEVFYMKRLARIIAAERG